MVRELFSNAKQYFLKFLCRMWIWNKPKCTFVPEITIWMNDKSPNFSLSRSFFFLQREIFEFPEKKSEKSGQKMWFPFRWLYNFHINEARIYYLEF